MPRVTVVVLPRDRLTGVVECIATLLERTAEPIDLIVPDLGYPRRDLRALDRLFEGRAGAQVVPLARMLPIEAISRVRGLVTTRWTFVHDNDSVVEEGWLDPLLDAAATGAAVVMPLILERDRPDHDGRLRLHFRVGELRVTEGPAGPRLLEHLLDRGENAATTYLRREASDLFEMHGVLFDTGVLQHLDLPPMTAREHVDLAMQVRAMGREIVSEPRSVVVFDNLNRRLAGADLSWFRFRWSEAELSRAERLFEERWGWRFASEDVLHDWTKRRRAYVALRHLWFPAHAAHRLARAWVRRTGRGSDVRDGAALASSRRLFERPDEAAPASRAGLVVDRSRTDAD